MTRQPDLVLGIYCVTHQIMVGAARMIAESDFIFDNGTPTLVLDWETRPKGDQWPKLTLPLNPKLLKPAGKNGYFVYDGDELVDPRQATPHSAP